MMKLYAFLAGLLGLFLYMPSTIAQGNLIIIPRRVIFEGPKRTQELNLANTGTDTAKYLISAIQYRMMEDGTFENIVEPDSGQYFADKNFRVFPRSVILGPNEAQTVKVQLINTSELKPGEYRSHLYFRSVPNDQPLGERETQKDTKAISVHLVPIFGISIPVIIRIGTSTTSVTLSDVSVLFDDSGGPQLKMSFSRQGNMSAYGDIKVDHISAQGKITPVGIAKGFAIYTPNTRRHFTLGLDKNANVNFHTGKLRVSFTASSDAKPVKIAEKELVLF